MTKKKLETRKQRSYQRQRKQIARRKQTTKDRLSSRSQNVYKFIDGTAKSFDHISMMLSKKHGDEYVVLHQHEVKKLLTHTRNLSTPEKWENSFEGLYAMAVQLRAMEQPDDILFIPTAYPLDLRIGAILPQVLKEVLDEMEQEMPVHSRK